MADATVARVRAEVARLVRTEGPSPGEQLLVAVSGGQDSLCLLDALVAAGSELRLIVFHLDHVLRGEAAARDAEAVGALSAGYGLEVVVRRADVAQYARRHRLSLEEAGRCARYQLLLAEAQTRQAWGAAVGHTADDQAESLLLNLLRGSGLPGLRGMATVQRYQAQLLGPPLADDSAAADSSALRVIRPLLATRRSATDRYCRELGLPIRPDPTNLESIHLRNRVRHHLIPVLESYNPSIVASLDRLAELADDDERELELLADQVWARVPTLDRRGVAIGWSDWRALGRGVQRRLLRRAQRYLVPGPAWSFQSLESARRLLERETPSRRQTLAGGVVLRTTRRGFELTCRQPAAGVGPEQSLEEPAP